MYTPTKYLHIEEGELKSISFYFIFYISFRVTTSYYRIFRSQVTVWRTEGITL